MISLKQALRATHVIAILCFFLPFLTINCNCGPSAAEKAGREKMKMDSIRMADSLSSLYFSSDFISESLRTTDSNSNKNTLKINVGNANKDSISFMGSLLDGLVYNAECIRGIHILIFGIDTIINLETRGMVLQYPIILCFILIIFSLIKSFSNSKKAFRRIFYNSVIEIICLCPFLLYINNDTIILRYGFWLTLGTCIANTIISFKLWKIEPT